MEGNAAAPPCNILFIRAGWDEMRCFQKKRKRETTRDCPAAFSSSSSSSTDGNKSISFHAGKAMQLHTRMIQNLTMKVNRTALLTLYELTPSFVKQ